MPFTQNIIKCLVVENEQWAISTLEAYIDKTPNLTLADACSNAQEASIALQNGNYDLLFLDSTLPDLTRLDLLRHLKVKPAVVLTGPADDLSSVSAHWEISDYLPKPFAYEDFLQSVDKLKEQRNIEQDEQITAFGAFLYYKCNHKIKRIYVDEVYVFESIGDYCRLHTDKGRFMILNTMKKIEKGLEGLPFYRIHRGFIVNAEKVLAMNKLFVDTAMMRVPVGNYYRDKWLSLTAHFKHIRIY